MRHNTVYIKARWREKILIFTLISILILESIIGHVRWKIVFLFFILSLCTVIDPNNYKILYHLWKQLLIKKTWFTGLDSREVKFPKEIKLELNIKWIVCFICFNFMVISEWSLEYKTFVFAVAQTAL